MCTPRSLAWRTPDCADGPGSYPHRARPGGLPAGEQPCGLPINENTTEPDNTDLDTFIPDNIAASYDVRDVINRVTDKGLTELSRGYADNVVTGFAHISGRAVGIVANQPSVL